MISKKGKTTNVQFAALKGHVLSHKDLHFSHPGELTYKKERRSSVPKFSAAFLSTGRESKNVSIQGGFDKNVLNGVEVGRYTPKYPQTKKTPSYSFGKTRSRDTNLFLFAPYTWMRNVSKPKVNIFVFLTQINFVFI